MLVHTVDLILNRLKFEKEVQELKVVAAIRVSEFAQISYVDLQFLAIVNSQCTL